MIKLIIILVSFIFVVALSYIERNLPIVNSIWFLLSLVYHTFICYMIGFLRKKKDKGLIKYRPVDSSRFSGF